MSGIGQFTIGVSAIGTPEFNWRETVISQYANSPRLLALIGNFADYLNQQENMDAFFDCIWNIDTAQGWGLDVWGRIVVVNRVIQVAPEDYLGFTGPTGESGTPFDVSPFYAGGTLTDNFRLTDDAFLMLILTKALANISNGSIPAINQLLLNLFPNRGNCYVIDNEDMTMEYHFDFVLTPVERTILLLPGVLPKPVGVASTVVSL